MFDKLVESEPAGAVRSRRNYFVVTTLAMSVLSLTAVVVSIFADDYSLNAGIDLAELISPVEMAQVAPTQPQPREQPRTQQSSPSLQATRTENVRNIAEVTDQVPPISTVATSIAARPLDVPYRIGPVNSDPGTGSGRGTPGGDGNSVGLSGPVNATPMTDEGPPPSIKKVEPAVPKQISLGVINGKAESLPIPAYPAPARSVGAQGQVTVEVTIDEAGRVISAHASSGHPLLKAAAEDAARRAKFSPTYLSHVPVKVTGVIVYNFNRG